MTVLGKIKKFLLNLLKTNQDLDPLTAYEQWAEDYDNENGNLMLHFDRILFKEFLSGSHLQEKVVLDFGCGTGRNWNELLKENPLKIIGCDISESMIQKLKMKFPNAETYIIKNNRLDFLKKESIDVIISTLVIAHIQDVENLAEEWDSLLKKRGEIYISDFHPEALQKGAKRTFNKYEKTITIRNYVHPVQKLEELFLSMGYSILNKNEKAITDDVKEFYLKKNALDTYKKFKNISMIYSLHLRK